jgi:hypothetical protein
VKFTPIYRSSKKGTALTFSYGADEEAQAIADQLCLDLDRIKDPVPHRQVPKLMSKYRYYIDVKRDFKGRLLYPKSVFSKTALEALSMGLKVIGAEGDVYHGFPSMHRMEPVIQKLFKLYAEVSER